MAEVIEGLVVIDEGSDPEMNESLACCWTSFVYYY
jgi:putative radical SAM-modified peptide